VVACTAQQGARPSLQGGGGRGDGAGAVLVLHRASHVVDEAEIAKPCRRRGMAGARGGRLPRGCRRSDRGRSRARVLYLEVRESNDVAQRLYRSRGFVAVGRRHRYYRNPVEDACCSSDGCDGERAQVMAQRAGSAE